MFASLIRWKILVNSHARSAFGQVQPFDFVDLTLELLDEFLLCNCSNRRGFLIRFPDLRKLGQSFLKRWGRVALGFGYLCLVGMWSELCDIEL